MPNETDRTFDATGSDHGERIADVDTNRVTIDATANRSWEPEVIRGSDDGPSTERVFESPAEFGDTVKRTKSGSIDGRTLRGRRRKSATGDSAGNETTQARVLLGSLSFGDLLYGIHGFLAELTKTPELAVEKPEAEKLGSAMQDVAKCYGHAIDPRVAAWIQLGMVASAVYGTRIAAIRMRKRAQAREARLKVTSISSGVNGHPQPDAQPEPAYVPPIPERDGII